MRSLVSVRKPPRFAAGRARALGLPTRGTTGPNRLRRVDRWIVGTQSARLRDAVDPLVVDLGYGQRPVTTVELASRLRDVRPDVRVLGLEIDPERVAGAASHADPRTTRRYDRARESLDRSPAYDLAATLAAGAARHAGTYARP